MKNIISEKASDKVSEVGYAAVSDLDDNDLKNKVVLDVGCGYGWFENYALSKNVKKIYGMEITKEDLLTAKKSVSDKRAQFVVGSANKIPFKDNSFDTVISLEVIEHIPKNTEFIFFKEVDRVLKKGGTFYLSTPYNSFFSKLGDPAYFLIGHRHYSKNELIKFGKKVKFKPVEIYLKGSWWSLISNNNMYISKWIFRRKRFFEDFMIEKNALEYYGSNGFLNVHVKYRKM